MMIDDEPIDQCCDSIDPCPDHQWMLDEQADREASGDPSLGAAAHNDRSNPECIVGICDHHPL